MKCIITTIIVSGFYHHQLRDPSAFLTVAAVANAQLSPPHHPFLRRRES
jgi:hypothetical protein